ncbi:histidine kinase [Clostridium sardiniense]|uniref:Histidine kinase n=1 Tax=Clostridium sardiniense TaxID=29369 RepID=A0ABS7KVV9_CLOSR|nr:histidine kinase [Clostridium sardiniense]MBY0754712.1 histidine kinase [Clostridium sardiniense]MDQ0460568.1 two-component system sensor histidine kinase YesM [Clostridium sardiniense]
MRARKSMIYKRLFIVYISVILLLITALDIYFINRVHKENIDNNMYVNEKVAYDVNDVLNEMTNSSNSIVETMYNDSYVVDDIIHFLNTDNVTYLKSKLNKFSQSNEYFYRGVEHFTRNSFISNSSLIDISFIGYDRMETRSFNRTNQIAVEKINKSYIFNNKNFSNVICKKNAVSFVKEIRNPTSLKSEGLIVLTYDLNNISNIVKKYNDEYEVMVLDENEFVVYDSNKDFEYKYYDDFPKLENGQDIVKLDNQEYYVYKITSKSNLTTVAKFNRNSVRSLPKGFLNSLIAVDIILFIIALGVLIIKLKKFSDRTDNILIAMEKVRNGDLNVSIPIDEKKDENDEIRYISENFNDMCRDLNKYIEKSYLAELDQKKAEMIALQNQINTHFLYNTLECIRMTAICNGDKEVGKMLYTLAFLFRKQVKDKDVITISDELEYCTKYIEIFKFRYDEKFNFKINCDESLLDKEIIKFTLQPIIENYFVHGIRLDDFDNYLEINIIKDGTDIIIMVKDNGNGTTKERINSINNSLKNRDYEGKSIGITNAHERIVIAYGDDYGIGLELNNGRGVMVVIKLPCREG